MYSAVLQNLSVESLCRVMLGGYVGFSELGGVS